MVYLPLLSNAYGAALFSAPAKSLEAEPRPCSPATSCSASEPVPPVEVFVFDAPGDGRILSAPAPDDDMETARTRPLRLDQIHL